MIGVSAAFLWSKNPYLNHPFVKSHVRVALSLHTLLLFMLFIMSYPFLRSIRIMNLTINDIFTAIFGVIIFTGIVYGCYKAYHGETITLGDMFEKAGGSRAILKKKDTTQHNEHKNTLLIFAHIPFLGYIIA